MNSVTDDALIISCHEKEASWVGDVRCSICGSMHPDSFYALLLEGHKPGKIDNKNCAIDGTHFDYRHLRDMKYDWLKMRVHTIFIATGVLFWWEGELLKRKRFNLPLTPSKISTGTATIARKFK